MYLVFSVFTSRPTSLLASIKVCVFFFMVSTLSPSRFTSSAWASLYNVVKMITELWSYNLTFLHAEIPWWYVDLELHTPHTHVCLLSLVFCSGEATISIAEHNTVHYSGLAIISADSVHSEDGGKTLVPIYLTHGIIIQKTTIIIFNEVTSSNVASWQVRSNTKFTVWAPHSNVFSVTWIQSIHSHDSNSSWSILLFKGKKR
jgi:hypothetical protein